MSDRQNNLNTCGCCLEDVTSPQIYNLQGLSVIRYRIGTHGSFKKEMLDSMSHAHELTKLTSRYDDDLAIATLDAWATVLDTLTFYQERICNEGFLRTAIERLSVVYLAQHVNYSPAPGLAAETYLAFSMNEAPGGPSTAEVPVGTKVQSVPKQNQSPQIFETVEEIEAKVEWNSMRPLVKKIRYPKVGDTEIYLEGTQTGLQQGDKILIVASTRDYTSTDNNWEFHTIIKVTTVKETSNPFAEYTVITLDRSIGTGESTIKDIPTPATSVIYKKALDYPSFGISSKANVYLENSNKIATKSAFGETEIIARQTNVTTTTAHSLDLEGTLQSADNSVLKIFVMRQKANLFGYNAPGLDIMNAMSKGSLNDFKNTNGEWKDLKISSIAASGESQTIYLDALYPRIVEQSWLIMANPQKTQLFGVNSATESARSHFTLASKTTRLGLTGDLTNFESSIRQTMIYAQSEELQIAELQIFDPLNEKQITLESIFSDLSKDQKIFISGKRWRLQIPVQTDINNPPFKIQPLDSNSLPLTAGISLILITQPIKTTEGKIQYTVTDDAGSQWIITDDCDSESEWKPKNLSIISAGKDDEIISELHTIDSIDFLNDGDSTQNHTRLTLNESIDNYFDGEAVTINANVARANHGETKQEILGNGDGSQIFQKFQLKQKPLTFTSSDNPNGRQTTLEIRVNNIRWDEVSSFYGTSSSDKIYTATIADDGTVTVCFGDGINGSRLPTGIGNVKATYRTGIGFSGLMDPGQLSMLVAPQLGVNKVNNPIATSGAQDPGTIDSARELAPVTVLTLNRIVSIKDFENFTRAYSGISKARADIIWSGEQEIVFVTVALADGTKIDSTNPIYTKLLNALKDYGHTNCSIELAGYTLSPFTINAGILTDAMYLFEDVKQKVIESLFERFSFDSMSFGQAVTPSVVIDAIQKVEGVVYVQLTQLGNQDPFVTDNYRLLANLPKIDNDNKIQEAELLVIDINNSSITAIL